MDAILEVNPSITDTSVEQDALLKELQQMSKEQAMPDDFVCECPDDTNENELFEESSSIFTIDGKKKEFQYVSSFNKNGNMISFGQDALGLWWYFDRTGLTSGKNLHGPYRGKEKLLSAMEKIDA